MKQRWTLNIERFSKIEKASIEISPMMVFVGDNNSGKSYIMVLLWGLLARGKDLFNYKKSNLESFHKCDQWLKNNIGRETKIEKETQQLFVDWFNDLLKSNKKSLLKAIFNYSVDIGNIEIVNYIRQDEVLIKWDDKANRGSCRNSKKQTVIKFPYVSEENITNEDRYKMLNYICWNLLMNNIAAPLYAPSKKGKTLGEPVYLPASRTGFMLSYKSLADDAMSSAFLQEYESHTDFTLPITNFVRDIATLKEGKNNYEEIIQFIESNILNGKAVIIEGSITSYEYNPKGLKRNLPLYVTSSLVSEVMPLLVYLKSTYKYKVMLIEELEAHLHPRLQRIMIQTIIRLINNGLPIWFTTHSDTVFQQINNMIKLKHHENREQLSKKYNYEEQDMLNSDDVRVYQLSTKNNKTEIRKLEANEYGFPIPTFNEVLIELQEETIELLGDD